MPGFGNNDPMYYRSLGYRSGLMQSGVKSYNGYSFPPCLNSQITIVPEYDDSGRTTKYLTIAMSLEFILTDTALTAEENSTLNADQKSIGMQLEVSNLLKRLSQPCQTLVFTASGFGDFIVNASGGVQDVDFGPKPQVIEYEMLGGSQAAKVVWLCVTRVPPCLKDAPGELIQFNYSTSWGIDNAGFMARTIEGSAEIPLNRSAQLGDRHASNRPTFPAYQLTQIKKKILKAFPREPGFRRQISYQIKNDRKHISFKIEDIEIRSGSPFLPGISDIEVNQNMSSSLEDGGFMNWKIVYSGTIEVVNAKAPSSISDAKKIAWVWLGKFLQSKRTLFENTVTSSAIPKNKPVPPQNVNVGTETADAIYQYAYSWHPEMEASGYNSGALIYPVHISITDSIYSNVIQFTIAYVALVTTDLLAKSVGLFEPVKLRGLASDSWVKFIDTTKSDDESIETYEEGEVIVDLCHSLTTPSGKTEPATSRTENFKGEPILGVTAPTKGKDWIDYQCAFNFIQDHQNVMSAKLHDDTTATQDFFTTAQMQAINAEMENFPFTGTFTIPGAENDPEAQEARIENKVYSPNPSICYVEVKGYAVRFNGRINPPVLVGVGKGIAIDPQTGKGYIQDPDFGGALAHQYGEDKVSRKIERTGLRDESGREVVKHYCSWTRMYVLDRKPITGNLLTTGLPHRFKQDLRGLNGS